VAEFYKGEFTRAGLKVSTSSHSVSGQGAMEVIGGEAADGSRRINVVIMSEGSNTRGNVTYTTK